MKPQGGEHIRGSKPDGEGLAAYRRLVELQKQMVELVKKNEQSKHACQMLRQQIAHEAEVLRSAPSLQKHVQRLRLSILRQFAQTTSLVRRAFINDSTIPTTRQTFES